MFTGPAKGTQPPRDSPPHSVTAAQGCEGLHTDRHGSCCLPHGSALGKHHLHDQQYPSTASLTTSTSNKHSRTGKQFHDPYVHLCPLSWPSLSLHPERGATPHIASQSAVSRAAALGKQKDTGVEQRYVYQDINHICWLLGQCGGNYCQESEMPGCRDLNGWVLPRRDDRNTGNSECHLGRGGASRGQRRKKSPNPHLPKGVKPSVCHPQSTAQHLPVSDPRRPNIRVWRCTKPLIPGVTEPVIGIVIAAPSRSGLLHLLCLPSLRLFLGCNALRFMTCRYHVEMSGK
ncbi:hypothetical protein E2C01_000255 [Portunus trituberculatus]|uniref:Uncharacterized protein n=1 Tax=Portunus trituberculatus TaxID=210409 RepID=A0A5B7CER1_PORTR|nr:hypothetical protein [Portunus trituberculatus]